MKKFISVVLALVMLLSFAACGDKNTNEDPLPVDPDALINPQIDLGENLPSFVLTGEYHKDEVTEEQAKEGIIESYTATSEKLESLTVYRVPSNNASIMDRMTYEEWLNGYEPQELMFAEFDTLIEPNDYHYGYYIAYEDGEGGSDPYYLRNYIFLDGDEFVKATFKVPACNVEIVDYNIVTWIPYGLEQIYVTDEEREDNVLCAFGDNENYADFKIRAWDNEGKALKDALPGIEEKHDVRAEYFYDYPLANGNKQSCVYLKYYDEVEGVSYMTESVFTLVKDRYIELSFTSPAEEKDGLKKQMSAIAMMWSIDQIK